MGLLDAEPDTSLHDDLVAAFESSGTPADTSGITEIPPPSRENGAGADADKGSAPAAAPVELGDRARGPDGKFIASKDSAAQPRAADKVASVTSPKAADAATPSPSKDTATKASEPQPSTAADAPPVGWTADAKTEWSALSPAIKAAVLKREAEISSGGRQWSEQKRHYEETLAPVAAAASRRGIQPAEAIQRLMTAQDYLDRDPAAAITWLARSYGVDLTVNGQQPTGAPSADGSSRMDLGPVLMPIQQQLSAISARFAQEDRRQTEVTQQNVERFANDPTHPHFDAVADEIMVWIPHVKAQNPYATPDQILQEAYDRAVHGNPTTRAALHNEQLAAADRARRATNGAEVAKARLAASSVHGSPSGMPAAGPRDTIREELEAAWGGSR